MHVDASVHQGHDFGMIVGRPIRMMAVSNRYQATPMEWFAVPVSMTVLMRMRSSKTIVVIMFVIVPRAVLMSMVMIEIGVHVPRRGR